MSRLIEGDPVKIAAGLTAEQRDGLLRARLMVSGDYRLPRGPTPFDTLSALGLAREGGYLTALGLEVRNQAARTLSGGKK